MEPPMNADKTTIAVNQITEVILRCAYRVSNTLGCGFLEKVYENAMAHDLQKSGLKARQQHPITVHYDGVTVGEYVADLLVENCVLVELKTVSKLDAVREARCLNYLSATDYLFACC